MFDILEWRTSLIMALFSVYPTPNRIQTSIVAQWLAYWAHNPAVLRLKLRDAIPDEGGSFLHGSSIFQLGAST